MDRVFLDVPVFSVVAFTYLHRSLALLPVTTLRSDEHGGQFWLKLMGGRQSLSSTHAGSIRPPLLRSPLACEETTTSDPAVVVGGV